MPEHRDASAAEVGRTRIVVVDDHRLVRVGLRSMLEATNDFEVVGEASDGRAAVAVCQTSEPDVVLMDLSMPGMDGIEATRHLKALRPDIRVLVVTSISEGHLIRRALDSGAVGYLVKDAEPSVFLAAVRAVARGESVLDSRAVAAVRATGPATPVPHLTPRDRQVLELIRRGMTNGQMARALEITETTVKTHVENVYRQLGVNDRTSAALWAERHPTSGAPA